MNGVKSSWLGRTCTTCCSLLLALLGCAAAKGQSTKATENKETSAASSPSQGDLTQVSIENLMNMEVTSVSKKEQKLSQVAAAIFVITPEDIRNSGATNIPELLRMVPGLDVAQINSNTWAISARGFNFQFASKLLVLIDGRAVYTPLFGGVNWDTQEVPLEDIERIEVIRGPGGAVWGANAVNGVINVITKKAEETPGVLVTGGGGTRAQGFGTLQYGGKIAGSTNYRIFTNYQNNSHFPDLNGQDAVDGWHLLHAGFRADTKLSQKDSLATEGDVYTGTEGAIIMHSVLSPAPEVVNVERLTSLSSGNILGRWNHNFSSRSDTTLQFYFDEYRRGGPDSIEFRDSFDFDFQNHLILGAHQDLIWGLGYRHTEDDTEGTIDKAFVPADSSKHLFNLFVQDQIMLKPDRVSLYVGTKLENSYFTGLDLQPSVHIAWTPNSHRTLWAGISRASRTPARRDVELDAALAALPGPAEVVLLGNPNMKSEHVIAYELGYQGQPIEQLSLGVTAFVNTYHDLESTEPRPAFIEAGSVPPLLVIPKLLDNKLHGMTDGVEVYLKWKPASHWTLSPGYSLLQIHLHTDPTSLDTTSVVDTEGSSPRHQAQLRSHMELWRGLAWDANAYFVGRLPAQMVASYTRLDTQLTWRFMESGSLSVVGQNLLRDHHVEFNDAFQSVNSSQVKRSAYVKLTWHF
jgi:iron complex outermembrane receptor protein